MANWLGKELKRSSSWVHLLGQELFLVYRFYTVAADVSSGENASQSWTNRVKTCANREQSDKHRSSSEFITRSKASIATQVLYSGLPKQMQIDQA